MIMETNTIVHKYETEDIEEENILQTFQKSLMHQFIVFVSSGLPDKFLKKPHCKLHSKDNPEDVYKAIEDIRKEIKKTIQDNALKTYLEDRLNDIQFYQKELEQREADEEKQKIEPDIVIKLTDSN